MLQKGFEPGFAKSSLSVGVILGDPISTLPNHQAPETGEMCCSKTILSLEGEKIDHF